MQQKYTMTPRIPAPAEVVFTSVKQSLKFFLTITTISIPTSCFEVSWLFTLSALGCLNSEDKRASYVPSHTSRLSHQGKQKQHDTRHLREPSLASKSKLLWIGQVPVSRGRIHQGLCHPGLPDRSFPPPSAVLTVVMSCWFSFSLYNHIRQVCDNKIRRRRYRHHSKGFLTTSPSDKGDRLTGGKVGIELVVSVVDWVSEPVPWIQVDKS